jgi:hypothetical protein
MLWFCHGASPSPSAGPAWAGAYVEATVFIADPELTASDLLALLAAMYDFRAAFGSYFDLPLSSVLITQMTNLPGGGTLTFSPTSTINSSPGARLLRAAARADPVAALDLLADPVALAREMGRQLGGEGSAHGGELDLDATQAHGAALVRRLGGEAAGVAITVRLLTSAPDGSGYDAAKTLWIASQLKSADITATLFADWIRTWGDTLGITASQLSLDPSGVSIHTPGGGVAGQGTTDGTAAGLSAGGIAGIVVGALTVLLASVGVALWALRDNERRREAAAGQAAVAATSAGRRASAAHASRAAAAVAAAAAAAPATRGTSEEEAASAEVHPAQIAVDSPSGTRRVVAVAGELAAEAPIAAAAAVAVADTPEAEVATATVGAGRRSSPPRLRRGNEMAAVIGSDDEVTVSRRERSVAPASDEAGATGGAAVEATAEVATDAGADPAPQASSRVAGSASTEGEAEAEVTVL